MCPPDRKSLVSHMSLHHALQKQDETIHNVNLAEAEADCNDENISL